MRVECFGFGETLDGWSALYDAVTNWRRLTEKILLMLVALKASDHTLYELLEIHQYE
jgi:hypothetical protein